MPTSSASSVMLSLSSDFIEPSQACINPAFTAPPPPEPGSLPAIVLGPAPPPPLAPQKAQISLTDCLACSGCVTSAETVLLQQQSVAKFVALSDSIKASASPFKAVVVTLSSQSRASLATRFNATPAHVHQSLSSLFKSRFGAHCLLNAVSLAQDIALVEVASEFVARYRSNSLPLLTSACPGWVCYAEKSHPGLIPFLSTAKSAQQVSGTLVKQRVALSMGLGPEQVLHVCVMPCPDKKLEAARLDFVSAVSSTDVDLVLTTTEVCDLLLINNGDSLDAAFARLPLDPNPASHLEPPGELNVSGEEPTAGGSGGFLSFCFRFAARQLFNVHVPPGPLPFRPGRNADSWSVELHVDARPVLRFEAAYGFRNIQSIVRKMKNKTLTAHFVEIMACPAGCANGGGQLPGLDLAKVRGALDSVVYRWPGTNPTLVEFYRDVVRGEPFSIEARRLFHTQFHEVEKLKDDNAVVAEGW